MFSSNGLKYAHNTLTLIHVYQLRRRDKTAPGARGRKEMPPEAVGIARFADANGARPHGFHGNVQVSVRALAPALRNTRKSPLWPGSTTTSTPARKPRTCAFGVRKVLKMRPFEVVATVSTIDGSIM